MNYLVNLNLNGNELQNVVLQVLATAPANPNEGQMYYDSTDKVAKQYKGATRGWEPIGDLNVIEVIKVNGTAQTITNKSVDITVPTKVSDIENDTGFITLDDLPEGVQPGDTAPLMDGTADAGEADTFARADHVHPSDTSKLNKSGGTMSGNIAMGNNKVTGLAAPTADGDAANKAYVDDAIDALPVASDDAPLMDGTADAGDDANFARADHVHPTDTTRQAKITASGILKGNGNGGVTTAVPETDYGTYSKPSTGIPKSDLAQAVQDSLDAADDALPTAGGTMSGNITMGGNKVTGLGDPSADGDAATKKYVDDNFLAANLKGAANGVAELDANGKVPAAQLPSYVDDVLEYNGVASFPATGETGKIYVDTATNKTYRWGGSVYAEISESIALGETASTAYAGDKGKEAHDLAEAALPKAGGTMSGAIAMGSNKITGLAAGTAITDAVNKGQLDSLINIAFGTIGTNATSIDVAYTGGLINAYAEVNGERVVVDISVAQSKVTFSVTQAPASAIVCTVVYAGTCMLVEA